MTITVILIVFLVVAMMNSRQQCRCKCDAGESEAEIMGRHLSTKALDEYQRRTRSRQTPTQARDLARVWAEVERREATERRAEQRRQG